MYTNKVSSQSGEQVTTALLGILIYAIFICGPIICTIASIYLSVVLTSRYSPSPPQTVIVTRPAYQCETLKETKQSEKQTPV
uniref:Uncharacterized protein n=1 Tax=Caenorhabditis japonica TaxID=281687 RepID=A0A8R1E6C3_CAEJA